MSFATIPVYGFENLRLYREVCFLHTVFRSDQAKNHPIYAVDWDFGCFHLSSQNDLNTQLAIENIVSQPKVVESNIWKLYFDGSCSKEGVGEGIVLISPNKENITQSCKLEFEVTNNVAEYEAFLLGLELARSLKVQNLSVFFDSELIVNWVRNLCQTKHPRLKSYRNEAWDTIENFFQGFNITSISRDENMHADSLVVSVNSFKIPEAVLLEYQIQVKYRPSIPDNLKHWQIFEDDE